MKQNKLKVNGKTKEFDGFFEDEKCLYFVESKMYKRGPRKEYHGKIIQVMENLKTYIKIFLLKSIISSKSGQKVIISIKKYVCVLYPL